MIYVIGILIVCFVVYILGDAIGHNPTVPSIWTRAWRWIGRYRRSTRLDTPIRPPKIYKGASRPTVTANHTSYACSAFTPNSPICLRCGKGAL